MIYCVIVSLLIFTVFNFICIKKFDLLSCYSAYGKKWEEWGKTHPFFKNINLWSVVTFLTAALLIPPMLVTGMASPIQFICFFAPLYLFLVAFTPGYLDNKRNNIIHQIGAWGCTILILLWLFLIVHQWVVILPVFTLALVIALGTRTWKESYYYYLEMSMFLSTFLVLLTFFV